MMGAVCSEADQAPGESSCIGGSDPQKRILNTIYLSEPSLCFSLKPLSLLLSCCSLA